MWGKWMTSTIYRMYLTLRRRFEPWNTQIQSQSTCWLFMRDLKPHWFTHFHQFGDKMKREFWSFEDLKRNNSQKIDLKIKIWVKHWIEIDSYYVASCGKYWQVVVNSGKQWQIVANSGK